MAEERGEVDDDATIVRRPPAPVVAPVPPGARLDVLAGRFFGAAHGEVAARLAAFIAGAADLREWLGPLPADRPTLLALLDRDIATIDRMIARQLDAIMHHPRLRRLEGSWRGLAWLAQRLSLSGRVKLRCLTVSWPEICRDLERATAFDRSHIFRAVYEDEFGIAGGEPYGLLVIDHEVRHRPGPGAPTDDVSAIAALASVAGAAFCPLVIGAAPALFGVDDFAGLNGVADPAAAMATADYMRWRNLAQRDDSRFVAVALPRALARLPWDEALNRHRGFRYRERMRDVADQVWMSTGYLIASCVIRAFDTYAWPADMRGYDIDRLGGGVVEDLPMPIFSVDPDEGLERAALEVTLTDRQERALVAAGLLPVGTLPFGGQALIGAARSLQSPPTRHAGEAAEAARANARLSAQFNTMICVARFAHYVKIMGRDMVGAFKTAPEIQRRLQEWLMRYATSSSSHGAETMAKYPLRGAAVTISEMAEKPGFYNCIIQLQPHFQLDDIAASFRLMTEIAAPGVGR
jgi:type VI secretion system protein ImpD/type VI secretion system protein ImpC